MVSTIGAPFFVAIGAFTLNSGSGPTSNSQPTDTSVKPLRISRPSPKCSGCIGSSDPVARLNVVSRPFAAAIGNLEQHRSGGARRILRREDEEIGGKLHAASRIARREIEVGDRPVMRIRRIELEEHRAGDFLVWAGGAEPHAVGDHRARRDRDARDVGPGGRGQCHGE